MILTVAVAIIAVAAGKIGGLFRGILRFPWKRKRNRDKK